MHDYGNLENAMENANVAVLRTTYVYAWRSIARLNKRSEPSTEELEAQFNALLAKHDAWVIAQHDADWTNNRIL